MPCRPGSEINGVGMDVKFFEMKALGPFILKWRGLLAQFDKSTAGIDEDIFRKINFVNFVQSRQ